MNDTELAELRRLQARAYSADADIESDPSALSRLHELEGQLAATRVVEAPIVPVEQATPHPVARDEIERDPWEILQQHGSNEGGGSSAREVTFAESDEDELDADDAARARRRQRRVRILTWVGSVVVAAVVAASVTASIVIGFPRGTPQGYDVRWVTALSVDPIFELPRAFGDPDGEAIGYESFHGLAPISTVGVWSMDEGQACLLLVVPANIGAEAGGSSYSGPFYSGCAAGDFPPIVQIQVGEDLPAELRERYPDGSGLQFVLSGDEVFVFSN